MSNASIVFGNTTKPSRFADFWQGAEPLRLPRKTTSEPSKAVRACGAFNMLTWKCASQPNGYTFSTCQLPKVVWEWCALHILTWNCASSHNGVRFFDISTSKSGPMPVCFVQFDFQMCFAPQRNLTLWSHKSLERHNKSRLFYLFAHLHLLSSDSFSALIFSSSLLFSDSSHLCFSIWPYCRKFHS